MDNFQNSSFRLLSDPNAEKFYEKMGCKRIATKESPVKTGRIVAIYEYDL